MPGHDLAGVHEAARAWWSAARDGEAEEDPGRAPTWRPAGTAPAGSPPSSGMNSPWSPRRARCRPVSPRPRLPPTPREQARPSAREQGARLLLAAAGVAGIVLAVLSLTEAFGAHAEHDLLGFEVAFVVGFLLCARDPARHGRALLPITAVASLVVLLPSAAAAASAPVDLLTEAGHLAVLAGLAGLVLLAGATRPPAALVRGPDHGPGLRAATP